MQVRFSPRFIEAYQDAPPEIHKAIDKQLGFLEQNLRHPSLHAKKYNEALGIWQARVSRGWRMYFSIIDDVYYMHDVMKHPK